MKHSLAKSLLASAMIAATGAVAEQSQPANSQPNAQQQNPPRQGPTKQEASKDELKVSESEVRQEVTDANKASKIMGMKVVNKQNEDIGTVKDLVVDIRSGRIAYAVLSSGGTLGMGDKLVAIPVESLTVMEGQKAFVIDADKNRLSQAAGFSQDDWPAMDSAKEASVGLKQTQQAAE